MNCLSDLVCGDMSLGVPCGQQDESSGPFCPSVSCHQLPLLPAQGHAGPLPKVCRPGQAWLSLDRGKAAERWGSRVLPGGVLRCSPQAAHRLLTLTAQIYQLMSQFAEPDLCGLGQGTHPSGSGFLLADCVISVLWWVLTML